MESNYHKNNKNIKKEETPNPDMIINIQNFNSKDFNKEYININSLIKKKSDIISFGENVYKYKYKIKSGEYESTYLLSSEKGKEYIIKKFKLYKQKTNANFPFKIIKEIKRIESLNCNYINKVLHYFIEKDNKKEKFCILYECNTNSEEILFGKKELNIRLIYKILFRLIIGIQTLCSYGIVLSLHNLNSNFIFFDSDYNIIFDVITKFIYESISDESNILEKKNDFFSAFKEKCINNNKFLFFKQINAKNITIKEIINNDFYLDKFFEYNLLDEILNSGNHLIILHFFSKFQLYFNLARFKWLKYAIDNYSLICRNCSSYFKIFIKNKETIILKCMKCNILNSEKISYIKYFSSKLERENIYSYSNKLIFKNFVDYFEMFSKLIKEQYLFTENILINMYQSKGDEEIIYQNSLKNILLHFFKELKININLILLGALQNDKLYIIKEYFNENEQLKFKSILKEEEEKYLIYIDNLSYNDKKILEDNIKDIFRHYINRVDDSKKTREYTENMLKFSGALKKYTTIQKMQYPNDYIDVDESLKNINNLICSIYSNDNREFVLSLLAKCLENYGIKVNISKKENEEFENIELASLQSLVSFGNQKKYELHFELGKAKNKDIIYNQYNQESFVKDMKSTIAQKLNILHDNLILTDVHHGCVGMHSVILDSTSENEEQMELLINDPNLHITRINKKPFIEALEINPRILSPLGDRYSNWGENEVRGGENYIPPKGWIGIGLNVLGKYDYGNDLWLDYNNKEGEFAIAYLGLNNYLIDKQQIISGLNNLDEIMLNLQSKKMYKNEKDIRKTNNNFFSRIFGSKPKCGDGICVFQNPDIAEICAGVIEINKVIIKIILMCRVNPKKIRQPENYKYCWILNPTPDEIRPYRILIKKIPTSPLIGDINNKILISPSPINYIISAINSNDFSFYNLKNKFQKFFILNNREELSDELFAIKLYSSMFYIYINDYLREKIVKYDTFKEEEIKSWICCLQNSLKNNRNVQDNTIVYRGVKAKFPSEIVYGSKFYFREFISTSLNKEKAKGFAGETGTILKIIIKNNGTNGNNNYCFYIRDISDFPDEEEILISSHCCFTVVDISRGNNLDHVTLVCEGYFNFNIFDNNIVYAGKMKNGKKIGFGHIYWEDGSNYEGNFDNDFPNGYGIMIWKNNNEFHSRYEGFWQNNKRKGFGKFFNSKGYKYTGLYEEDKLVGFGKYYSGRGNQYLGQFKNSLFEGFGMYYWNDGDKYVGDFKNDFQMGIAILEYKNGNRYEGEFNQAKEGIGTFIYSNSNKYEGEWKNNFKNGRGIFYLSNGNKYEGWWKNNRKILDNYINDDEYIKKKEFIDSNKIKITYIDEDIYEGEYDPSDLTLKGKGTYYFNNNDKYIGYFNNNLFNGKGELILFNNCSIIGQFNNGALNGKGIINYNDGSKIEGEWVNGSKEGIFIETFNNNMEKKLYKNDKFIKYIE